MFKIAETDTLVKNNRKKKLEHIYEKIRSDIYPVISREPHFGPNIKKLTGNLEGLYRYRIGNYRLVYTLNEEDKIIFMNELVHRKDVY